MDAEIDHIIHLLTQVKSSPTEEYLPNIGAAIEKLHALEEMYLFDP